jgi:signal transduction histidine kinase
VRVCYATDQVQIEVIDDGPAQRDRAQSAAPGTGHGLVGLRERAMTLGGTLDAGPAESGGFRVSTHLPTSSGSNA